MLEVRTARFSLVSTDARRHDVMDSRRRKEKEKVSLKKGLPNGR